MSACISVTHSLNGIYPSDSYLGIRKRDEGSIEAITKKDLLSVSEKVTYVALACIATVLSAGLALFAESMRDLWDRALNGFKDKKIIHLHDFQSDELQRSIQSKLASFSSYFFKNSEELLEQQESRWIRHIIAPQAPLFQSQPKSYEFFDSAHRQAIDKVTQDWTSLQNIEEEFKSDKAVVIAAINQDARALTYAHASLRNDPEIVTIALQKALIDEDKIDLIGETLQKDQHFIKKSIALAPFAIQLLNHHDPEYITYARMAAYRNSLALQYVSPATGLLRNKQFMLEIISGQANALQFADESLKNDPQIVTFALKRISCGLEQIAVIGKTLCENQSFIKEILLIAPLSIQFLKPQDPEYISLAYRAVHQDPFAFSYLSGELKKNKELALMAVRHRGFLYDSLDNTLKKDQDILEAYQNYSE